MALFFCLGIVKECARPGTRTSEFPNASRDALQTALTGPAETKIKINVSQKSIGDNAHQTFNTRRIWEDCFSNRS